MNNHSLFKDLTPKTRLTFETIIKVARKQFSKRGYANTSIHTIAKHAKISVGCIYKYFKNKDSLYKYIISEEQSAIKRFINSQLSGCTTRFEKEVEGLRAWLMYVKKYPDVYKLIRELLFYDKKAFDEYYNGFAKVYARALEKDKDELENDDYYTDAFILIGISNFLGVQIMSSDEKCTDEDIDRIVETFKVFLKNGLIK